MDACMIAISFLCVVLVLILEQDEDDIDEYEEELNND